MKINMTQYKSDIATTTKRIRELKALQRESHQPHWGWKEAAELRKLKFEATKLCTFRAALRGKVHDPRIDEETRKAYFEVLLEKYALKEVKAVVEAA
jgi:hypothetical protein